MMASPRGEADLGECRIDVNRLTQSRTQRTCEPPEPCRGPATQLGCKVCLTYAFMQFGCRSGHDVASLVE